MIESWKDIKGYEGLYQVSDLGRVRRNRKIIKPFIDSRKKGYKIITLCKQGKRKRFSAHRLVTQAFLENPKGLEQVNHKDGNPSNNSLRNLEWVSNRQNTQHAYDTGLNSKAVKMQVVDLETKKVTEYPTSSQASKALGYCTGWLYWAFKSKGDSFKLQTKLVRKVGENHVN